MFIRPIILAALFICCQSQSFAQKKQEIKGVLTDMESTPLVAATVVLLQLPDSSFADYGLSADDGKFRLSAPQNRDYILQISYVGYAPHIQNITLDKDYDLGVIKMEEAANMLDVAQIEATYIPIRMNGDTLEFNAAAFNVQAHDDVAKLLEQMPGVEIAEDGTVKINGKKVEKILVDGKEFFGTDVQIALKNLPADAIKKVEVFDNKTDKEELTGADSKTQSKTLNLTLKEDKKEGFMGNVEGGYGYGHPNHHYKGSLSLNYFNAKMRLSLIGASNNINQAGFTYKDFQDMSGGYDNFMSGNAAMSLGESWNDPVLSLLWGGGQQGITRSIAGGFNLNFFPTTKTEFSIHYLYTNANRIDNSKLYNRAISPDNFYTINSNTNNLLLAERHVFNTKFTHKFDSTQELRFRVKFQLSTTAGNNAKIGETLGKNDTLKNQINQDLQHDGMSYGIIANLYYQKKFQKKGRTFSANTAFAYANNRETFDNYSATTLYDNYTITQIDTLSQKQESEIGKQVYGAEMSYTEPLGEGNLLEISLKGGFSKEGKDRKSFDIYEQLETPNFALTDIYQKLYNFQQLDFEFKRDAEKYSLDASVGIKHSGLEGILASNPTPIIQNYVYPVGSLSVEFKISESKQLYIYYDGTVDEPQLEQLQPMLNNQNPLSISLGNPNLIPEYRHGLNLYYNLWNQATFTSFYLSLNGGLTQNTILQSQSFDESFRITYIPVNGGLSYSANLYLGYNTEIKNIIKIGMNGGGSFYQSPVLLNGISDEQYNQNYNISLNIGNKDKKIFDISISGSFRISNAIYAQNKSLNVTSINHRYIANAGVTIAKKWNIKSKFSYSLFENLGFGSALDVPLLSASISRTFLKGDELKIELSAENLLNEAYQVNRYSWNGAVTETQTNMLGRYFMLSISYKISKMGGAKPPQSGGDNFIIIHG